MNIQITGHGITVTPSMREYMEERFSKLNDHFHGINSIKLVVNKPDNHHVYHLTTEVHATKATLFAKAHDYDFYKAADQLKHKITRQIDKHHDILMQRHHHPKEITTHLDLHHDQNDEYAEE
jgi:putative sigma-54 modulation protein